MIPQVLAAFLYDTAKPFNLASQDACKDLEDSEDAERLRINLKTQHWDFQGLGAWSLRKASFAGTICLGKIGGKQPT